MPRDPIPTHSFAIVVVRLGRRVLVVRERADVGGGWYFPAGRVEPGESLADAAHRETLEEAGVPIVLDGLLRVEHRPLPNGARLRAIFSARPADDAAPKASPDEHTQEARYATLDELRELPLRGGEVQEIAEYVLSGGAVHPLGVLGTEGAPWRSPPRAPRGGDA